MRSLPVEQAHIEVDGPAILVILVIVFLVLCLDLGIRSVHHLLAQLDDVYEVAPSAERLSLVTCLRSISGGVTLAQMGLQAVEEVDQEDTAQLLRGRSFLWVYSERIP